MNQRPIEARQDAATGISSLHTNSDTRRSIMRLLDLKRGAFALVATLLSVLCWSASAATYYVSTGGSDSAPGTQAQPWRTIQRAANLVNPGDIVLVNTGVYREKVQLTRSGAAGRKIVFKNAPGHYPVIEATGVSIGTWGALVSFNNVSYVRMEGFEIRYSPSFSVHVAGESHHLEMDNLSIHSGASSGIFIEGPLYRPAMSVISRNKVYNNSLGGVTVWNAPGGYYRIEGNEVWGNKGTNNYDAIQVGGGSAGSNHVIVKNNLVYGNGSANKGEDPIDLGGHTISHHYLVEGNVVHSSIGSFKLHSGSRNMGYYQDGVSGFHIARFNRLSGTAFVSYGFPNPITVYHNTFFNPGQGFMLYNSDGTVNRNVGDSTFTGGDTGRMNWKNNILWQEASSTAYMLLQAGTGGSIDLTYRSIRMQNNLYKFSSGQRVAWNGTWGAPVDDTAFGKYKASNSPNLPDSGSVRSSAAVGSMFVDAFNRDFHLVSGSPAIDRGTALTRAVNAGTNSTTLRVDRASYFHDGFCVNGECLGMPDSIVIGNGTPVKIVSIVDSTNTIVLAQPMTWSTGASVTLPFNGSAPDMGAHEYGGSSALTAPTNLRVSLVQ